MTNSAPLDVSAFSPSFEYPFLLYFVKGGLKQELRIIIVGP